VFNYFICLPKPIIGAHPVTRRLVSEGRSYIKPFWFPKFADRGIESFGIGRHLEKPEIGGPLQRHVGCYVRDMGCYATTWNVAGAANFWL
jgi:hypothetical protein